MKDKLQAIREKALEAMNTGELTLPRLDEIKIEYLGKKGTLTALLRGMGSLSAEERPVIGQLANQVRQEIEQAIDEKKKRLKEHALNLKLAQEKIDVTVPGRPHKFGSRHPLYQVEREICDIFVSMGFDIVDGP